MLVAQVTIGLHSQRATVLVAKPTTDCRNINARLNAPGSKQMPQIVVRELLNPKLITRAIDGFLTFGHRQEEVSLSTRFRSRYPRIPLEFIQKGRERRNDRNTPQRTVLRGTLRVPPDLDHAKLPIHVLPSHPSRFIDPASGVGQEFDQIRTALTNRPAGGPDLVNQRGELLPARNPHRLLFRRNLSDRIGRIAQYHAVLNADFEDVPKRIDRVVEPARRYRFGALRLPAVAWRPFRIKKVLSPLPALSLGYLR